MSKVFKDGGNRNTGSLAKHIINQNIKASSMMVIDDHGHNHGVLSKSEALNLADDQGLDLVQVGEKEGLVVVKLMDYGKFLYDKKKQLNDAKKNQKVIQIKEIKMRPNIGDQDYRTKLNKAIQFFKEGKKVKLTLQFKGREVIMMADLGKKFFERIEQDLSEENFGGVLTSEKESKAGSLWIKIYFVR